MIDKAYTVIFEPAEEGGWLARVPALNDLVTEGETLEEAKTMVRDAINGFEQVMYVKFPTTGSKSCF
ncbi:MAG: type II toxin-antitoxin system HicB family antitoxin [bacterium]|nr:type II toxin-antitoxin system HicB family antitoxin [bacterium]